MSRVVAAAELAGSLQDERKPELGDERRDLVEVREDELIRTGNAERPRKLEVLPLVQNLVHCV